MDFATISSVVLFIISIVTFITGLITKAQNDGKVLARIEQMQQDLVEIKGTLKEKSKGIEDMRLITEQQEQRIKFLEGAQEKLEHRLSKLESGG